MLLAGLVIISLVLTCTMFITRQPMLGFACCLFWAITGAQAYTLSTSPWRDIYYYLFFASAFGMTLFTALAAFGLREKRDALGDEEDEGGETAQDAEIDRDSQSETAGGENGADEAAESRDSADPAAPPRTHTNEDEPITRVSRRTRLLRERARNRRTGG